MPRNGSDILLKYLVGAFRDAALDWMGIHDETIVRAYPTELANVEIRQNFLDLAFETDRGELLHFEFQTTKETNLYRFLLYDAHLSAQYRKRVRTVVFYVKDVIAAQDSMDAGGIQYKVENVYLKSRDAIRVLERVERQLQNDDWQPESRFDLAFAPHMSHPGYSDHQIVQRTVELAMSIPDQDEQNFMAAILLELSGKMMGESDVKLLKEVLRMRNIVKEIEMEAEARGEARGETLGKLSIARNMLRNGMSVDTVVAMTGLDQEQVRELQNGLN
ncbi:transposase [Ferroacidibacillus organovorans]|nr:transposase [Ferroacidibacillus organovorans]